MTTKKDLDRVVKAYVKNKPESTMDPSVYSKDRKMGLVNCFKEQTDTRILRQCSEYPYEHTIISIVHGDAKLWIPDEDKYHSITVEPPSPEAKFPRIFQRRRFSP